MNNNTKIIITLGTIAGILIIVLLSLNIYQFLVIKPQADKYNNLVNEYGKISVDPAIPAGQQEMDKSFTQQISDLHNFGKIYTANLPECSAIDNSKTYGFEDIIRESNGRMMVVLINNISHYELDTSNVNVCKSYFVKEANDLFAMKGQDLSVYSYFPWLNLVEVSKDENYSTRGFYNTLTKQTFYPTLPEIKTVGNWNMSFNWDSGYGFYLFYPSVIGGCGIGEEGKICMDKVYSDQVIANENNPVYLFRSDG
jgi:hypothetical protein